MSIEEQLLKEKPYEIESLEDKYDIMRALQNASKEKERVWLWQYKLIDPSERETANGLIKKVDTSNKTFEIHPYGQHDFIFETDQEIFMYFEKQCLRARIRPYELHFNRIRFPYPKTTTLMQEDFLEELKLFEKEDELKNLHYRQTPRVQAKGKSVGVRRATDPFQKVIAYPLYDMSSGGAGLVVKDPTEFLSGQKIILETMDKKSLNPPLKGRVMAIREMDDGHYKVGIQFDIQPYQKQKA